MPVHSCQEDGKRGWKWGGSGKCYTYTDEEGSKRAHAKAEAQGRAVRASGWRGKSMEELELALIDIKKSFEELKKCQ